VAAGTADQLQSAGAVGGSRRELFLRGPHRLNSFPALLAEHLGDAGTGEHRPGRDLVAVPPRNGRARRYAALALGLLLYGPVITATTATSYRSQHTSCPGNVLAQDTDLVGVSVGHVQKRL
jgi:hypothetical protein